MELRGKGALITGASRGLGKALAAELAGRGARVVMVARGAEELRRAAAEIVAAGGEAHALAGDIADKRGALALAAGAAALVGDIDLLVHNASTLGPLPMPLLLDTECEDLASVLETNLVGPFRVTKAIAGSMAMRGGGLVVHISSDAAIEPYPRWGSYGVSKAALDHLGRIWAAELADMGVRFVSVDPGEMDTRMHAEAMPDADRSSLARPEDVASRIVAFLESARGLTSGARMAASSLEVAA
jgi:NAD(P)-dependent dehydrogenase (short-subunit alcohol dehydrogenase family)